jgi:hypothetical protein
MAIQTINIGNVVNDGLGDDLRTAFEKVNANFQDLSITTSVTAKNLGTNASFGLFSQKVGTELQFKGLLAGSKINLVPINDTIQINATAPDAFTSITTETGSITASAPNNLAVTIQGGSNITTSSDGSVITIDTVIDLNQILQSYDFGSTADPISSPIQLLLILSNIDFGSFANPSQINLNFESI